MMSSSSLPSRYLSTRHAAGLYASWLMSFLTLPAYPYKIQQHLLMSCKPTLEQMHGLTHSGQRLQQPFVLLFCCHVMAWGQRLCVGDT